MYTPHSWELPANAKRVQSDWLNQSDGPTCTKCGVTLRQNVVNLSHTTKQYNYIDAAGKSWTSTIPIGCPAFMGDAGGAAMSGHQRIRDLKEEVAEVSDETSFLRQNVSEHESRLDAVEAEQARQKEQLEATQRGVGAMIAWMGELVAAHRALGLPTKTVTVGGEVAMLPEPLADLILDLGRVDLPGATVYALPTKGEE